LATRKSNLDIPFLKKKKKKTKIFLRIPILVG
jgi:hypothetical protein